jgi:hypothetical protein
MMMPTTIRGDLALMACLRENGQRVLTAAAQLTPHPGSVVLVTGPVSALGSGSITVSGITCALAGRTTKPVLGMPTVIKDDVEVGDNVMLVCREIDGQLVTTGLIDR